MVPIYFVLFQTFNFKIFFRNSTRRSELSNSLFNEQPKRSVSSQYLTVFLIFLKQVSDKFLIFICFFFNLFDKFDFPRTVSR